MRIGRPSTLRGWLIAIMVSALITSQLITFGALIVERRFVTEAIHRSDAFRQIDNAVQFVSSQSAKGLSGLEATLRFRSFRVTVAETPSVRPDQADERESMLLGRALAGRPVAEVRVARRGVRIQNRQIVMRGSVENNDPGLANPEVLLRRRPLESSPVRESLIASVRLRSGDWLNASVPRPPAPQFAPTLGIAALLSTLCVTLAALWAANRLTRPLSNLAEAAERIGQRSHFEPAPEEGPEDLRRVAREFNAMGARVDHTLAEQQFLLRAIGHDLRTPLSSLTLRLEFVEDEELKAKMAATIAEMKELTSSALEAARGGAINEPFRRIDLGALAEAICEDAAELGKPVTCGDIASVEVLGRSSELRRAIQNLVDNGVRHGGAAAVSVRRQDGEALVLVDDRGPGIAEGDLARVMEPFVRLDSSRGAAAGGHGLGLTIARAIAERHHGRLSFRNRAGGGLTAVLGLPANVSTSNHG